MVLTDSSVARTFVLAASQPDIFTDHEHPWNLDLPVLVRLHMLLDRLGGQPGSQAWTTDEMAMVACDNQRP